MKKTYLLFIGIVGALGSCKKDYSCSCTYTYTSVNTSTGETIAVGETTNASSYIINDTKNKAREKCEAYSYTLSSSYVDSYTGETIVDTYTQTCAIND